MSTSNQYKSTNHARSGSCWNLEKPCWGSSYPITLCKYKNHIGLAGQRRPCGWTMTSIAICSSTLLFSSSTLFFSSSSTFLFCISPSSPSALFEFGSASMWIYFPYCEDSKAWIPQSWSQIVHFANTTQFIGQPFFSTKKTSSFNLVYEMHVRHLGLLMCYHPQRLHFCNKLFIT